MHFYLSIMYVCSELKQIRVRYIDDTDRDLSPEEIQDVCQIANKTHDSIERVLMKKEQKEVRYVEINPKKYKTLMNNEGKVLKPMPPY
jgi:hypothetical protein